MISEAELVTRDSVTETTLGALSEYITSGSRDWSKYYAQSGAMFIRTQDINKNRLSLDNVAHVQLPAKAEGKRSLVRKGDLLITITGANVGKVAVVEQDIPEAYVSQSVCLVRLKDPTLAKFLQLQLVVTRSNKSALEEMAYGLGRPVLNLQNVRSVPVRILQPTVRTEIIAEIEKQLSRLDDSVASLERIKANLARYEVAVLKDAVAGRIVVTEAEIACREGHSYETSHKLLNGIVEIRKIRGKGKRVHHGAAVPDTATLPILPKGWAWARLDAIASIKGGITVDKNRKDPSSRRVPYLRVANVQRGYLDLEEVKVIEAPEMDIEELRLRRGDILFNEGGDRDKLGRGWIWEDQLPECIHQNHVFRARLYSEALSAQFISWWGNTFGQSYFMREGKQTTNLASVNMKKLAALPVPIPPPIEQRRIVVEVERRLAFVYAAENEVDASLRRAVTLRNAILRDTFRSAWGKYAMRV